MSLVNLSSRGQRAENFTNVLDSGISIPADAQVCIASYHGEIDRSPVTANSYDPVIEEDFSDAFIIVDSLSNQDKTAKAREAKHTVMPRLIELNEGEYTDSDEVRLEIEEKLNARLEDWDIDGLNGGKQLERAEACRRIASEEFQVTLTPTTNPPVFKITKRKYYSGYSCLQRVFTPAAEWQLIGNYDGGPNSNEYPYGQRPLYKGLVQEGGSETLTERNFLYANTIIVDPSQAVPTFKSDVKDFPQWTGGNEVDANGNFRNQPLAGISLKFKEESQILNPENNGRIAFFIDKPIWTGITENSTRDYNLSMGEVAAGQGTTQGGAPWNGQPQVRDTNNITYIDPTNPASNSIQGFADYGNIIYTDMSYRESFVYGVISVDTKYKRLIGSDGSIEVSGWPQKGVNPMDTSPYEFGIKCEGGIIKLFAHYTDKNTQERTYHECVARRKVPVTLSQGVPPMYYYAICPRQDWKDGTSLGGVFANGSSGLYGFDFYQTKRDNDPPNQDRFTPVRVTPNTNNWEFLGSIICSNYTDTPVNAGVPNSGPNRLTYHMSSPMLYLAFSMPTLNDNGDSTMAFDPFTNYPNRREFVVCPMFSDSTDYTVPTGSATSGASSSFFTVFDELDETGNSQIDYSVGYIEHVYNNMGEELGRRGYNLAKALRLESILNPAISTFSINPQLIQAIELPFTFDFSQVDAKQNFIIAVPSLSCIGLLGNEEAAKSLPILGHGLVNVGHQLYDDSFAMQMPIQQWVDLRNSSAFTLNNMNVRLVTSDGLPYRSLNYFEVMLSIRKKPETFSSSIRNELIV